MTKQLFENLFVLELANNHWGDLKKGKEIISQFANVVHKNNIKAAIKLQIRDCENFIHKDFTKRDDILYVKKVLNSKLSEIEYKELVDCIKSFGLIPMATPFDEKSVDICERLNIEILKIASADIQDSILINKIISTKKPVIISTGGASLTAIDSIVDLFKKNNIDFALNHCVSKYPTEKNELELNQIDLLKNRYKDIVVGFSTHEYNDDIEIPMYIAYAKGARTFERHIDIEYDGSKKPYSYTSSPEDINRWFIAFNKAKEICGSENRNIDKRETVYLNSMTRGLYAKEDLKAGDILTVSNTYFAIPLQSNQLSCNDIILGKELKQNISKDSIIDKSALV